MDLCSAQPPVAESNQMAGLARFGAREVAVDLRRPALQGQNDGREGDFMANSWTVTTTTFSGMLKQPDKHDLTKRRKMVNHFTKS
jgi:hypothetical protein